MTRRVLLLNLALLALAGTLVWTLRLKRVEAGKREAAVLAQPVVARTVIEPPAPQPPSPVTPANYLPVAEHMLFSKDRNPTVVVEPPPAKPEPPMPTLPVYHGQMAIGEPVALLSTAKAEQKGYHAGDAVGEFKLVSFNAEKIAFEWMGKTVERKLAELAPKEPVAGSGQPPASPRPPAQAARPGQPVAPVSSGAPAQSSPAPSGGFTNASASSAPALTSLSGGASAPAAAAAKNPTGTGDDVGGGVRNCLPSDTAPDGTIRDGLKKVVIQSMFGPICRWEPVK